MTERKVYWPDNPMYVSLSIMLTTGAFAIFLNYLYWPVFPFPFFLMLVLVLFFYSQRIVIDNKYIAGPTAYGKRQRRTKILKHEAEAFFEKGIFGLGHIVIRHKHSSNQIIVPFIYFSISTLAELRSILPVRL